MKGRNRRIVPFCNVKSWSNPSADRAQCDSDRNPLVFPSSNQQATNNPTASNTVTMVNQSLRAHQSVSRKQTPKTILATLLATISKPAKINNAPIIEEPS